MIDWILGGLVAWLVGQAVGALDTAADIWPDALFTTPDLTALPQVQALSGRTLWVVNTAFIVAVLAAGIIAMTYDQVQVRYSIKELAPRLVFAAVAANFASPSCRTLIDVANAVTMALADQQITGRGVLDTLRNLVTGAQSLTTGLLAAVVVVVLVVLVFALVFGWLSRIAGLLILLAIAPAALACYALPYTEGAARLWWRSMLGCLGTQILQVFTVVSGLTVLLDPGVNLPASLGMGGGALVNLLLALVVLVTAVRIPGLVRRYVTRGGPGIGSYILRVVLVQQALRAVVPGGGRRATRVLRRVP
jgi:hypothetical protein